MSVLLVTDDADDDIENSSITNSPDNFYKQLKELAYDSTVESSSSSSSTSSILVKSPDHYQQHRRRCRCRPQQCRGRHWLTYMLTLLVLTNHLHWPVLFLSLSSIKIMSTHASTTVPSSIQTTTFKRPLATPSTPTPRLTENEQQCLPITSLEIDRICSKKSCRTSRNPFDINSHLPETHYLSFCSNLFNQTIVLENLLYETTETECRQILNQIQLADDEARNASLLFATYMQAIDCASSENRYSIITADCQKAYQTWTCSVKIPYFHRNSRILPCQTICDEVERVCPTFRPSDREPLFAGQPLFFCDGGIVSNSNYGHRPHCFDTCHLSHGSLERPSVWLASLSNKSSSSSVPASPLSNLVEDTVTTPPCFEIEPLIISPTILINDSITNHTRNTSRSASAGTTISSRWSSMILLTFHIGVFFTNVHVSC